MKESDMPQHKAMAMGEMPKVEGVESPWRCVPNDNHSGKGVLSDAQRSGKRA